MTTPDLAGLCERLKRLDTTWLASAGIAPPINPDGPEAAAAIESLVAALETIRDRPGPGTHYTKGVGDQPIDEAAHMAAIARTALEGASDDRR